MNKQNFGSMVVLAGIAAISYIAYKAVKKSEEKTKAKEEEFKNDKEKFFEDNDSTELVIESSHVSEDEELTVEERAKALEIMHFEAKNVDTATDIDSLKKKYEKFSHHIWAMTHGSASSKQTYIKLYADQMDRIREERVRREEKAAEEKRYKAEKDFQERCLSAISTAISTCGRYFLSNPSVSFKIVK